MRYLPFQRGDTHCEETDWSKKWIFKGYLVIQGLDWQHPGVLDYLQYIIDMQMNFG